GEPWQAPGREPEHRCKRHERPAFRRHLDRVVVESRHHVGAATNQRLQRLGAARVILQLHLEPFFPIEPELASERGRQINELVLTADCDANAVDRGSAAAFFARPATRDEERHTEQAETRIEPPRPPRPPWW